MGNQYNRYYVSIGERVYDVIVAGTRAATDLVVKGFFMGIGICLAIWATNHLLYF